MIAAFKIASSARDVLSHSNARKDTASDWGHLALKPIAYQNNQLRRNYFSFSNLAGSSFTSLSRNKILRNVNNKPFIECERIINTIWRFRNRQFEIVLMRFQLWAYFDKHGRALFRVMRVVSVNIPTIYIPDIVEYSTIRFRLQLGHLALRPTIRSGDAIVLAQELHFIRCEVIPCPVIFGTTSTFSRQTGFWKAEASTYRQAAPAGGCQSSSV